MCLSWKFIIRCQTSLNALNTAVEISLALHFLKVTVKRAPIGSLSIYVAQCIIGRDLSFSYGFSPNLLEMEMFSWIFHPLFC